MGESPDEEKIFFRKILYAKSFTGRISQYFFKNPKGGVRGLQVASKLFIGITNFDPEIFWYAKNISGSKFVIPTNNLDAARSLLTHPFGFLKKY